MNSPYKMKGKSPMMKALIGNQGNLNAGLKAAIEASPAKNTNAERAARLNKLASKYSNDPSFRAAQVKYNQAAIGDERDKKISQRSPAKNKIVDTIKKAYDLTMPKGLKKINKKIVSAVTGGKGKAKTKAKKMMATKKLKKVSPKGEYTTKENPVSRPDNKYEREGDKQYSKQKK